jgi:hypothetical protein
MDRQSVYSLSVLPPEYDNPNEDTRGQVQSQLEQFILQFRLDNAFIYRSVSPKTEYTQQLMIAQRSNSRECSHEAILLRC